MVNPNPARITDPMWRLWEDRPDTSWKLGGIYANKPGYHNSRAGNQSGNYSIRLTLDRLGPPDKAAAIDYTMSDAKMRLYTDRLRDSALNPADDRLAAVREFYGTLDSNVVFGLIKDDEDGPWRGSSADSTHLWHIHISIFRAFVDEWDMLEPILSVLAGESFRQWLLKKARVESMFCKRGDTSEAVRVLQLRLRRLGYYSGPADAVYGQATSAALLEARQDAGSTTESGDTYDGWGMDQVDALLFLRNQGPKGDKGDPGPAGTAPAVLSVSGTLSVH